MYDDEKAERKTNAANPYMGWMLIGIIFVLIALNIIFPGSETACEAIALL